MKRVTPDGRVETACDERARGKAAGFRRITHKRVHVEVQDQQVSFLTGVCPRVPREAHIPRFEN